MRWFLLVALVAVSCKSKSATDKSGAPSSATPAAAETSSGKAGMSKFTLTEAGDDTNKATIELAVPSSWQADSGQPASWKMDGARMLQVALVSPRGSDNAARVEKAIKMQDLADGTRNAYPDGRVWVSKQDGANIHARMFVPYAGGVAMGIAVLSDASKLDSVKSVYETMKVSQ